ncbi:pantoate--beta-alanine ligase [Bacteriovorax sp. Seq25_V]|uniref:pantoate--beta-alanine ligase n=1 Tax=Bacteriovorax sp. Seq25_V TaxID=1201288 RepID=UPI000389F95A|nr:pantoate--beta-alanine ligase [Bacteriovorax sp. Seq25_V]EQC47375.1 pantoate--beta-alanine ligase [Bacteriovorax sp. Seq25_V]
MVKVIRTVLELKQYQSEFFEGKSVGLVPTMGNLHEGHLSLLERSVSENDISIITIFVNPKQFGPNEDFDKYPRTLEQDVLKIEDKFSENILVFAPKDNSEIYPEGFDTTIQVGALTKILCGANRPGHFDGVTTVVYQLFSLSKATNAYFGQKDYQQVKVIEKMTTDLHLPIKITMMPISRDQDGLARSSRNQYLSASDRETALLLPRTLVEIESILKEETWVNSMIKINEVLESRIADKNWDYLEILDASNLKPVNENTTEVVLVGAFRVGSTRLIDNRKVEIKYA